MEKHVFLSMLKSSLLQMNVPSANIEKHIEVFEKYFSKKTPEDTQKIIKGIGGVDGALDAIYKIESKRTPNILKPTEVKKYKNEVVSDTIKKVPATQDTTFNVKPENETIDNISQDETCEINPDKSNESTRELPKVDNIALDEDVELLFKKKKSTPKQSEPAELEKTTVNNPIVLPKDNFEFATELPPIENDIMAYKNKSVIVELFKKARSKMSDEAYRYSLPFTMILNAFIYALLALLFPALAILATFTYVLYFGAMIGGGIISIISMIYGIVKLGSSVSIGLYEFGIGIIIIGLTLLLCVLIYNFNKKLVPYLYKKVKELFMIWIKVNKVFFRKAKKEVRY